MNLQTIDPATISAAQKAALRDQLASLQKRVLEGQKKAAAANKQRATQAAVADADKAVTAGQRFGIMRVDVGLDPKALLEAWNAIQKQHPKLPVIMFSTDEGKTGLWQSALCSMLPGDRFADFGSSFCEVACDAAKDLFRHNSGMKFSLAAIPDLQYLGESHVCLMRLESILLLPFLGDHWLCFQMTYINQLSINLRACL